MATTSANNKPIIIIGGGIAGLTTAVRLTQRGIKPIILEANPQLGGRLRDEPPVLLEQHGRVWQFPQEHGVHGLWEPYVNLKSLLAELEIAPRYVPAQDETWILGEHGRVRYAKIGHTIRTSRIPAPFHYLQLFLKPSFIRLLNIHDWASVWRISAGLFTAMAIDPIAEQQPLHGLTLADLTRGWSPHMRAMFAGLARNALAAEPDEIPAAGFIAFLRFYTLLRRKAWGFDLLPAGGGTAIIEPLAQIVRAGGGEIRLGCKVEALQANNSGGWQVRYTTPTGEEISQEAGQVVLALDPASAKALLLGSKDTAVSAAQRYFPPGVATAIIRIWYGGRLKQHGRVSESGMFSGDFIVHNFFWLDRLQDNYKAWAEATGGSAIEMHIYGSPDLLAEPDALLLARVVQDANRAFPELREKRLKIHLQRNPATHTLFGLGTAVENIGVITPWQNIYACGDWVYHENPALYLERATTTALSAANEILQTRGLEPFPILPHPAPEPFAGWLAKRWYGWRQWAKKRRAS
jgi:carotenoid phi-ring synthase / carotenoid chi-ring synthase